MFNVFRILYFKPKGADIGHFGTVSDITKSKEEVT